MKKILSTLILLFSVFGMNAFSQDLVYRPFYSGGSGSNQNQSVYPPTTYGRSYNYVNPGPSLSRATAVYLEGQTLYKVHIQVDISSGVNHYGGTPYYVVSEYRRVGYNGQWQSVSPKGYVQKCNPLNALGINSVLEKNFMYKSFVNGRWYYFDM